MNSRIGRTVVGPDRDRGQLLLIAAISIAFIVLGLIVAFNGIMYTGTIASGGAGESMDDVNMTELEIKQGVDELQDKMCSNPGNPHYAQNVSNLVESHNYLKTNESPATISIVSGPPNCGDEEFTITYTSSDVTVEELKIDIKGP